MKKTLSLLLMLLIAFSAVSCAAGDIPEETTLPETTHAPETEPAPTTVSLIDENGKSIYRIVRPDEGGDGEIQAGIDLKISLKEQSGTDFSITTDFLMPNESIEKLSEVPEILIGATNRPESTEACEGLGMNEYVIRVIGNKIVIAGGSEMMTYRAMKEFLALLSSENTLSLSKDTNIREEIERGSYLVALTNQGNSHLEVYDISEGKLDESSLVWSYKTPYYNIAGTKLRHSDQHGDVALAVCGSSYGCMISYPAGELLWYTEAAANNPHSIELMPCGVIAIASSTGGEVRFFTTENKVSRSPAASMKLEDAHGVLWDDERQVLWAIGRTVLTAYKVSLGTDGSVTVTEESALRATIPSDHAHDLAPVYGNTDELWISTGSHVYRFSKSSKAFSSDYAGHESLDRSAIKGVGNFDDGSIVYIYPDGGFKSWTSRCAFLLRNADGAILGETLRSETGHFYKIRVWDTRYQ